MNISGLRCFSAGLTHLRLTRQQDWIALLAGLYNLVPCREDSLRAVVKVALCFCLSLFIDEKNASLKIYKLFLI